MRKQIFVMDLKKAQPVQSEEGVLTRSGMRVANQYAKSWVGGQRTLKLEREYPELAGLFYDIRVDSDLAREHAIPLDGDSTEKSLENSERFLLNKAGVTPIGGITPGGYKRVKKDEYVKVGGEKKSGKGKPEKTPTRRNWIQHMPGMPRETADLVNDGGHRVSKDPPVYSRNRKSVHDRIINAFFDGVTPPAKGTKKTAIVLMGGPASGKTSIVKRMTGDKFSDFVNVNPDDVKEMLPEYRQALEFEYEGKKSSARDAAFMVHEESSDIAGEVYNRAIDEGMNIVLDGTGKSADKHIAKVEQLRKQGYHVQLLMPDVDMEEAVRRSSERAEKTGRFVPTGPPPEGTPDIIRKAYKVIPGNFERIAREADEFALFDSRGFPPGLKWSGGRGQQDEIHDAAFVQRFKKEAKMRKSMPILEKSEDGATPAISVAEVAKRIANAPAGKGREDEKKPKKFDKKTGVVQIVTEVDYEVGKRLKYE